VRWRHGASFAVLTTALALAAPAKEVPYLAGHVNDTAGMIPPAARARIEADLVAFEKATGAQVAVLTVDALGGEPLEDYSLQVAQTWKLGRKGVDDGVLLLIAKDDRKMRLEVGYGLEGKLPDVVCKRILDDIVRPAFRDGDFGGGIEAGVGAVIGTIQGKDVLPKQAPARVVSTQDMPLPARLIVTLIFVTVIGVFSLVALVGKGGSSWFLYVFLMPFYAVFPWAIWGTAGALLIPAWVVGFPIAKYWLRKSPGGKGFLAAHPGLVAFAASSGHSGSGGGWSSGGGFSGGGGSFGGGGSSSSW
jgi:uncharacterized protein